MLKKIINNLKLLFNPVLINAYVFYENGRVKHGNWGDDINYFFLREICKRSIGIFDQFSLAFRFKLKNYLVIGSTIDMLCRENTEVWGAGIIDGTKPLRYKPKKVYAVRGPLTRKVLLEQGVDCPEVYGDPALLISRYYQPKVKKKYKYGLISHVSNRDKVSNLRLDNIPIKEREDVLIIDLSKYDKWTDILDQICSCESIISSSLHGLIMAEAYEIPNVWIEFGKPLIGGHFKFHDFFTSIGKNISPLCVDSKIKSSQLNFELDKWQKGVIDIGPLVTACPFELLSNIKK